MKRQSGCNPCIIAGCVLLSVNPASAQQTNVPTFNQNIGPIIFTHCAGCHRPGQAAPFSLLSYADVRKRSKLLAEVVGRRYMPPWLPAKGHGDLADDRSLSAEEAALLGRWVAEGALEGSSAPPPLPKWVEGWQLGAPDLVVTLPEPYTLPAEGKDIYRNFVVSIPLSQARYVQGVEFLPGNWKVVHHAFIQVDTTGFSRRRAQKETPSGFEGMSLPKTAIMPAGQMLSWQPGKMPRLAPDGLSWKLETNTDLVLQLHLHPTGKPETVQPSVGFHFTDRSPTNAPFRINLQQCKIDIPAGAKDYAIEESYVLPIEATLLGILPHAHYLGKRLEGYCRLPDGTRQDLLLIPDWDFNWQGDYRYKQPVLLPKGTTLSMRFTYDNSAENVRNPNRPPKRVRYGLQATDEMGELWFQVLPRDPAQRAELDQDFYAFRLRRTLDYDQYMLAQNPNDASAHLRAGTAQLQLGRVQDAFNHFQAAIKADPKCDGAYYQLGFMYQHMNRLPEAQAAFETCVRLNPDDYEAQGSLGYVYLARGELDRAEERFRAALKANPDDAIARKNLDLVLETKGKSRKVP